MHVTGCALKANYTLLLDLFADTRHGVYTEYWLLGRMCIPRSLRHSHQFGGGQVTMDPIRKILEAGAKYGRKFTDWVRNNSGEILSWVQSTGGNYDLIIDRVRRIVGV